MAENACGLLVDLVNELSIDLELSSNDIRRLNSRVAEEGISFLTKTLPLLAKALLAGLETGHLQTPPHFKKFKCGGRKLPLPRFLGSLFCRVFDYYTGELLENPDIVAITTIRQICEYAYKIDAEYSAKENDLVVNRFVETEAEVSQMNFSSDDPILRLANYITSTAFGDFESSKLEFRHGPGATANVAVTEKFEHRLSPNLPVYEEFAQEFFYNARDAFTRLDRHPVSSSFDLFRPSVSARVVLVPKDSRGPRLISAEPCENQFIQQGIADWMVRRIESYSLSAGHVNFTDQTINQELARTSSISKSHATLDLKDASDRNSFSLFSCVFGGASTLMRAILACRTDFTVLPDGRKIRLSKFAPMGSALCFPVMAWTIYSILLSGFILSGQSPDIHKEIYVYGDDIIVPNNLYHLATGILTRYGFAVNTQKSYSNGHFRESCGGDYFKGVNVTPLRVRKLLSPQPARRRAFELLTHGNLMSYFPSVQKYCWRFSQATFGWLPFSDKPLAYLYRAVLSAKEAREKNKRRTRSFPVYGIKPEKGKSQTLSFGGHATRVRRLIGNIDSDIVAGVFDLPRKWTIVKKGNRSLSDLYESFS